MSKVSKPGPATTEEEGKTKTKRKLEDSSNQPNVDAEKTDKSTKNYKENESEQNLSSAKKDEKEESEIVKTVEDRIKELNKAAKQEEKTKKDEKEDRRSSKAVRKRRIRQQSEQKKEPTAQSPDAGGMEGMDTPPRTKEEVWERSKARPGQRRAPKPPGAPGRPGQKPREPRKPVPNPNKDPEKTEKPTATTKVKQFSFPGYKILSGATVAAVKMCSQKVVIQKRPEDSGFWARGLFQTCKMSLRLRLLRLLFIWVFFRVLNKQTAWMSEWLGIQRPDVDFTPRPPRAGPGERYVKVVDEGRPDDPYYVKVNVPPGPRPRPPEQKPHFYKT